MRFCFLYVTCPSKREAQTIARELLKLRLAACVNILGKIDSLYRWKGKIEKSTEYSLIIKTRKTSFAAATGCIRRHHSYQVPAILQLDVTRGDAAYLEWMKHETR